MSKKCILMINCSEALMEFAKKTLERAGYDVYCAEGVSGADKHLAEHWPDCIIIDRELADGNAFDFCRKLKEKSRTPVLFVSFDKEDELKALRSGSDDFLKRPVDYTILKARISILLNKKVQPEDSADEGEDRSAIISAAPGEPEWAPWTPAQKTSEYTMELFEQAQESRDSGFAPATGDKAKSSNRLFMAIAACVMLAITGLIFLYYQEHRAPRAPLVKITDAGVPLGDFLIPDENARPYLGDAVETVNGPDYLLPCYERIVVTADDPDVRMILLNPEENQRYFTFEIVLKDYAESLYISGLVGPGMCIDSFTLGRTLPEGEHKAVLVIRVYESGGLNEITGATVDFLIVAM